ncbi:MAG: ABC transporter substrate-binding protein, partial [Coriobacteriales bacterium]|nr:ABC transporter substrate-binding protein [Coriobacteriales bacterium]
MAGCSGQTSGSSESGTPVDDPVSVSVASLKGPTSIGLAGVMNDADNKATEDTYTFDVQAQADAVVASLTQGTTNIALLPANVAATVYNKTKGTANAIQVLNINTLGVLYI